MPLHLLPYEPVIFSPSRTSSSGTHLAKAQVEVYHRLPSPEYLSVAVSEISLATTVPAGRKQDEPVGSTGSVAVMVNMPPDSVISTTVVFPYVTYQSPVTGLLPNAGVATSAAQSATITTTPRATLRGGFQPISRPPFDNPAT